jgi:hypothetical protein
MPVWAYEFWVQEGADVNAQREARIAIDKLVDYIRSLQVDERRNVDALERAVDRGRGAEVTN